MGRIFYMPPTIISGADSLQTAGERLCMGQKALIVTGNIVRRQPCMAALTALLTAHGVDYAVYSDIQGEPTDKMGAAGAAVYRENACDFMIAVGGGSPIDLMKAIGVILRYPETPLRAFAGRVITGSFVPMAAIPTTAGTGSEATMFTVITDTETDVKLLLKGPELIPSVAVVDPAFSATAPPTVTAYTGLDALTHAVESYTSRLAQPLTDTLSRSAVQRIMTCLPRAFRDGGDMEARTQMSLAALEAGACITNASVTLVHGLSRPIGALFHVSHGLSNAMLLPDCLEFALPGAPERFAALGRAVGAAAADADDDTAARAFLDAVRTLCAICKVPSPAEYGITREAFFAKIEKMSADAIASGSPGNTIRAVTEADCAAIYRKLWA
ncbi:MAG: iron-containing alcohol dehydrogenase [Oscillospiraceae bacterium]|nr:iron-containing alcohol dehydrogenase [Oscillospiraceae bacterium]